MMASVLAAALAGLECAGAWPDLSLKTPDFILERKRDSADRAEILRWYEWGDEKRISRREYTGCEGTLEFDFEVGETGWYELWQHGATPGWTRTLRFDGEDTAVNYETPELEFAGGWKGKFHKELNVHLKKGRHTLAWQRNSFPGGFPDTWFLSKSAGRPWGSVRAAIRERVVRTTDDFVVELTAGSPQPAAYELVADPADREGDAVPLGTVDFPAVRDGRPPVKRLVAKVPHQGVYLLRFREPSTGRLSFAADTGAGVFVVVDPKAPPPGERLVETKVVDIDCVKTAPLREVEGATCVRTTAAGTYRESSGKAPDRVWGLDGFSYAFELPDIRHTYRLEVDYPDDAFRSVGFWVTDNTKKKDSMLLTGGVETGGQYPNALKTLTHESYFYPRGTNCVIAVLNLNRGSFAAASRIRIYRLDGPLPAAPKGVRRGRLAGGFFEEPERWNRFFGRGNDPLPVACPLAETLRCMERWGQWNRYSGVNLMSPSVVAYQRICYPTKVMSGVGVDSINTTRMLALVAEKYGSKFVPHLTFHGDLAFDARMGIGTDGEKPTFADPDVVEWSREGKSDIAWRKWSYNPLHPKVQRYLVDVVGELADMLGDTESFEGIALRIPLNWQFTGITGLNSADYGYGDWNMRELAKDWADLPGVAERLCPAATDADRFSRRHRFLMSDEMRAKWLAWRARRIRAFYEKLRDRQRQAKKGTTLYFMWWKPIKSEAYAKSYAECGLDPALWRDVEGISFYGMQFFYGRRYFSPRHCQSYYGYFFDRERCGLSSFGKRACGVYSEYYECCEHLKWEKFGAKNGVDFDALEPCGDHELQNYAWPLAEFDAGCFFNGGNGWIFGTPKRTGPFLREYLALPTGEMTPVPGLANDPVRFRERVEKEGRFLYALNLLDVPVRVSLAFSKAHELVSAADGRPAASSFELGPYGIRAFLVKPVRDDEPARLVRADLSHDPSVKARFAKDVAFYRQLRADVASGHAALELTFERRAEVLARLDAAIAAWERGELFTFHANVSGQLMYYLHDITSRYPPNGMSSSLDRVGGLPANRKEMPVLTLERTLGGDPLELGAEDCFHSEGDDGRTLLSLGKVGTEQVRLFDRDGKYLRSPKLNYETPYDYNTGEIRSRHGFMANKRHVGGGPAFWTNGCWWVSAVGELRPYDGQLFRQKAYDGTWFPKVNRNRMRGTGAVKAMKPLDQNLCSASQLKVFGGKVWYMSGTKIHALDPQTLVRTEMLDTKTHSRMPVQAFALAACGDLYLALPDPDFHFRGRVWFFRAKKTSAGYGPLENLNPDGTCAYDSTTRVPTDLVAFNDGTILLPDWTVADRFVLAAWKAGEKKRLLGDEGDSFYRESGRAFGFHVAGRTLYVANGGTRQLRRIEGDKVVWSRKYEPAQSDRLGDLPVRNPCALTCDGKGRLYVVDESLDAVLVFRAETGEYIGRYGQSGTIDEIDGFSSPSGIAVVGDRLFVADAGNQRIKVFKVDLKRDSP